MSQPGLLINTTSAEWRRIWSVRSSWILAGVTGCAVVGFGAMAAQTDPASVTPGSTAWDAGQSSGMFALFGILALAAVTATADYGTGGIVPTLQWTPRRGVLFTARCIAVAAATVSLGVILAAAASVTAQVFLPLGLPVSDGLSTLAGLAFIFVCGALMSVGWGFLLRSTAGALVLVIALVMVLPMLLAQLGYGWSTTVSEHLPGSGALFLIFGEGPSDTMTVTSARATLSVWAFGALVLGGWRLLRVDANQ
ncbi:MAG: hypothetical protein ACSLEW_12005 [Nocardioides sp.]